MVLRHRRWPSSLDWKKAVLVTAVSPPPQHTVDFLTKISPIQNSHSGCIQGGAEVEIFELYQHGYIQYLGPLPIVFQRMYLLTVKYF